ncbi:MAG: caspase family protein [Saprospiraceae bacterium]|nr:caspase family protein [Saprospiraceae bacterium]
MKSLTLFFRLIVFVLIGTSLTTESAAQCISGNCQNGTGTYRYSGNAKYTGQFKNGQRNGTGKMVLANSNIYEGQFINNRMQGEGTMTYPNGDRYIGQWSNDMPNGKGKYLFVTKERYEGGFLNGEFDGQGTMTYPDGAYYTGSWKKNKKSGAGKMYDVNGGVITGTWANGKLINKQGNTQGNNTSTANNSQPGRNKPAQGKPSSTAKPDVNGLRNCSSTYCRNGQGFYDYPDGSRWVGAFKDGYPSGRGVCYYSNGDRYEGEWANNAPYGEGIMYFTSGRVYGAVWVNGSPVKELDADEAMPTEPVKMESSQSVRIWAVVVGVSKYTAMPSLKYTDDDAWKFYSHLISPEGGAVPENQISVLTDETATRENILRAMREKFLKADANDVVMLFYSGHGLEGCFLPFDYDGYNNKLRHEDVKQVFKQSKAKHKICIADACHSGSLNYSGTLVAKGPSPVSLQRYYQAFEDSDGGIALLMSSKSEELSLEDQGLRHGVFTYYVLQGLRGQADRNNDYLITVRELYSYVYNKVRDYTAGAQTPVLTGNFDDGMPVALRRY